MTTFGQRIGAPAQQRQAPAPAPARARYAGIKGSQQRDPMLGVGTYRVQVVGMVEGFNPGKQQESIKLSLRVNTAAAGSETPTGTTVTIVCMKTIPGLRDLKRFAYHAAGFGPTLALRAAGDCHQFDVEGEEGYNALDEKFGGEGSILAATAGTVLDQPAPTLHGRVVDVIVSRGKDLINPQTQMPSGDYFRAYVWGSVPDAEQVPQ